MSSDKQWNRSLSFLRRGSSRRKRRMSIIQAAMQVRLASNRRHSLQRPTRQNSKVCPPPSNSVLPNYDDQAPDFIETPIRPDPVPVGLTNASLPYNMFMLTKMDIHIHAVRTTIGQRAYRIITGRRGVNSFSALSIQFTSGWDVYFKCTVLKAHVRFWW